MNNINGYNEMLRSEMMPQQFVIIIAIIVLISAIVQSLKQFKKNKIIGFISIFIIILFYGYFTYIVAIPTALGSYDYISSQYQQTVCKISKINYYKGGYTIFVDNNRYSVIDDSKMEIISVNDTVSLVFGKHSKLVVSIEKINTN